MPAWIVGLLISFVASAIARALMGAGLMFAGVFWVRAWVDEHLANFAGSLQGAGADVVNFLAMGGFVEAMNIEITAVVAAAAIFAARHALLVLAVGTAGVAARASSTGAGS
jgi:hypothetical protein